MARFSGGPQGDMLPRLKTNLPLGTQLGADTLLLNIYLCSLSCLERLVSLVNQGKPELSRPFSFLQSGEDVSLLARKTLHYDSTISSGKWYAARFGVRSAVHYRRFVRPPKHLYRYWSALRLNQCRASLCVFSILTKRVLRHQKNLLGIRRLVPYPHCITWGKSGASRTTLVLTTTTSTSEGRDPARSGWETFCEAGEGEYVGPALRPAASTFGILRSPRQGPHLDWLVQG